MLAQKMSLHITLIHYYRSAGSRQVPKFLRWQTLIYGQLIPTSDKTRADFVIAIPKDSRRAEITVGKKMFGEIISGTLKARILRESRKRIAATQKKINAGKHAGDKEEFTIHFSSQKGGTK